MTNLKINGKTYDIDAPENMPLLWVLRDLLELTGTKYGCGIAQCGACTVHVGGIPLRSCSITLNELNGENITTIEGLAKGELLHVVQEAWIEEDVPQCGYCQSGQIMSTVALLSENNNPSDLDINNSLKGNICRCGTYPRIKKAIKKVVLQMKENR